VFSIPNVLNALWLGGSSFEYLPNLKPGSITLQAHYILVTSNEIEKQNQFSRFVFLLNSCQVAP
jgi:hypothetical protein